MQKFKKLSKSENIFLESGYASNGKWLFNVNWLKSVASRGNIQVRNRVTKAQVEFVNKKLSSEYINTRPVSAVVSNVNLKAYRPVDLSEQVKVRQGYKHGKPDSFGTVAFQLGTNGPCIDAEFYPALLWDTETTAHVCGDTDPIVVLKAGEIVAMVAPLNPKYLNKGN